MNIRLIFALAVLGQMLALVPCARAQVYEKVFDFTEAGSRGAEPHAALVKGSDGNFYGTTRFGGANNFGTVFKMTPAGELTTLVAFTGNGVSNKGAYPFAALVQGSDGNLYGTTRDGGASNLGTVFKMTYAGVLTTLTEFTGIVGPYKGAKPHAALVQDNDGNFYGTTQEGGANGLGTVFTMTYAGVLTTLVEFTGIGGDYKGAYPYAALVQGNDGNFYGTTLGAIVNGGPNDLDTVFKMTTNGTALGTTLTTLVEFTGNGAMNKGSFPYAALVQGIDGNFYGTTEQGGANGLGTIFKMTTDGTPSGTALETFNFTGTGGENKGAYPYAALVLGSDGNFYGTTLNGGVNNKGTVFNMTPAGMLTTLVEFTGNGASNKGASPRAGLVLGSDGNFYGTTLNGGVNNIGTVFNMTPAGALTTLVEFTASGGSNKGRYPFQGAQDSDGNFYGTTGNGGVPNEGTVFKMTPAGDLTTLVEFTRTVGPNKGALPRRGLVKGRDGNFYGTTTHGGAHDLGTVFKMTPEGVLTTLVEFTGNGAMNKGSRPYAGLVQGRGGDGNFYGTTEQGGANGFGTVFKMTPAGVLTTLVEFTGIGGANKGAYPQAALVQERGGDGNFYGTTDGRTETIRDDKNGLGTVFKMTPAGVLTTLFEFPGIGGNDYKGRNPYAGLVQGSDGDFYGTTIYGGAIGLGPDGADGLGTVFKMTTNGTALGTRLTTLVEFTGIGGPYKGANPYAGLVQGSDGDFYGTTFKGGAIGLGTVFKVTPAGDLTTIREFLGGSDGDAPLGNLIAAADGNLYGTTSGSHTGGYGTIYRLIFAGAPTVAVRNVSLQGSASAVVEAQVNARGASTDVWLDFGTDEMNFPNTVPIALNLTGYQTMLVGTTLNNLSPDTTYFFQFRAGTTLSPVQSFSTLAEPIVATSPATQILPTTAQFNGTVNARNFDSTVVFEWGTDGNSFPNSVPAAQALVTGASDKPVSAAVAGLVKGTTYFYRIVATSAGGTTVSGVRSFKTLTDPTAAITGAFGLDNGSASVTGIVNAHGSATTTVFEYGTDGTTFPNSVVASPQSIDGELDVPVTATLTNLLQSTTYHYRIRVRSAGVTSADGFDRSMTGTFDLGVIIGVNPVAPVPLDPRPGAQGVLLVRLSPATLAGTGWRLLGEQLWRKSGESLGGLATGNRQIEYRPVPGFLPPPRERVSIVSGEPARIVETEYFPNGDPAPGALTVTLLPDSIRSEGGQWRLLDTGDGVWQDSGASLSVVAGGAYLVEFRRVTRYSTPQPISVTVSATAEVKGTYYLAEATVGAQPGIVGFDAIVADGSNPYRFVGQLRSESGAGTGFVVRKRVVATAAHVVFDDGTLSAAIGLQWLFQHERGIYEPVPQIPRGSYILEGYTAARRAPGAVPGASTPESQNLDVAAVWFYERDNENVPQNPDAARGGYGGYLASNAMNNEWLLSGRLKTLVGYPLNDDLPENHGRMHATLPANLRFLHANVLPNDRVYRTDDITSLGGNSGGPLCVQYDDGNYFPAAIYLGGTSQTLVRVIDSAVITLFNSAETSSNTGDENTNGGQPIVNPRRPETPHASLSVSLEPAPARDAGAGWRIGTGGFLASGLSEPLLAPGNYMVSFAPVAGFMTPPPRAIVLSGGDTRTINQVYPPITPITPAPVISGAATVTAVKGSPFNYTITASNAPTGYRLDGTLPAGLGFNTVSGAITGTPTQSGSFALTLFATNSSGTGSNSLTLNVPPRITNSGIFPQQTRDVPFQFQITTSDAIEIFAADGLPPGMIVNASGVVFGAATRSGAFAVTLRATNAGGTATKALTLNVAPRIENTSTFEPLTQLQFLTYIFSSNRDPDTTYSYTGTRPPGLVFSPAGVITGKPTASGIFDVVLHAVNDGGETTQGLRIQVPPQPPGNPTVVGSEGDPFPSYTVEVASGDGTPTYELIGTLPAGLVFDEAQGKLTGIATESGVFRVTIKVTNIGGDTEFDLTITINPLLYFTLHGPGAVTPVPDAKQDYPPGTSLNLAASAQPGAYFAGWTGDLPSGETTLPFTLDHTRHVQANFQTFAAAKGHYTGLVQGTPATLTTTGSLVLTLDASGSFTGSLKLGKAAVPVLGRFGADGKAEVALSAGTLRLRLGIGTITGALDAGGATGEVLLVHSVFNGTTNPAPQAGAYTLVFAPDLTQPETPQGSGFGIATVKRKGAIRFTGTLADGTAVTQGASLSPDGEWPFFIPLANRKGALSGILKFQDDPALDGTLAWFKPKTNTPLYPAAFAATVAVEGSRFVKNPTLPANALITFNGGGIATPSPLTVPRIGAKKYHASGFALKLDPATGLLTGNFTAPGETKTRALSGVFLPKQQRGAGFFRGGVQQTGGFTLISAP